MGHFWRQYGLLLWWQWLEVKRNVFSLLIEICLPSFFAALLVAVVRTSARVEHCDSITWPSFRVRDRLPHTLKPQTCNGSKPRLFKLAYVPNNSAMNQLVANITDRMSSDLDRQALGFESEEKMERYLYDIDSCTRTHILAALVMTSDFPDGQMTHNMSYKLRPLSEIRLGSLGVSSVLNWRTAFSLPDYSVAGPREKSRITGGIPYYYRQGFLTLQRAVDFALIAHHNQTAASQLHNVVLRLQRHPYPSYTEDRFIHILNSQLPLLIYFSFFFCVPNITKGICLEKERRLKEFSKLHGLCALAGDLAFFTRYFAIYTLASALNTMFLYLPTRYGAMLRYTPSSLVFVLFLLYSISIISVACFVSVFFDRALSGTVATGAFLLITYMPFYYIQFRLRHISDSVKMWTSLLPNLAIGYASHYIAAVEGRAVGMQWSSIHVPLIPEMKHSLLDCFLFFLLDTFLYGFLAWYLANTLPREHGTPRPFYFVFTKQFWCRSPKRKGGGQEKFTFKGDSFETYESVLELGIQMRDLKKAYSDKDNPVVSGFSLDALHGQITVLVGRNGSGKTTVVSLLSGFKKPTSGEIYINGYRMATDLDLARSFLGFCPQQDILYGMMTIREHLNYYAKLKGLTDNVTDEVARYVKALHLEGCPDVQASELSVAQRRKLAVAIAFIADSKCVVLEAPTNGMDLVARRQTWELIKKERPSRTIFITTQSMDEAQTLADRIAILVSGAVRYWGSPHFLKQKICDEYTLSITSKPNSDITPLLNNIKAQFPAAQPQRCSGRQLLFTIPRSAFICLRRFLDYVESNMASLGILNVTAGTATLDDVFNKANRCDDQLVESKLETTSYNLAASVSSIEPRRRNSSLNHISTLVHEKSMASLHELPFFLGHIFLVVLFVVSGCVIVIAPPKLREQPSYSLSLDHFDSPSAPYLLRNANVSDLVDQLGARYRDILAETKASHPPLVNDMPMFVSNTTMDDYLLWRAEQDMKHYVYELMTAATFAEDRLRIAVTAHFNNEAFHTPAISLNLISNTLARHLLGDSYRISATNHPLPMDDNPSLGVESYDPNSLETLILSFATMFGFVFLTSSFVPSVVEQRKRGVKHLQLMCGVRPSVYWLATFLWDYFVLLVCALITAGIFLSFQLDSFLSFETAGALLLGFVLYGWAAIPLNYLLAFLFDDPAAAYGWITAFQNACSTGVIIAISILSSPALGVLKEAATTEWFLYSVLPHYALQNIIVDTATSSRNRQYCKASIPTLNMSREEICHSWPNTFGVCCPETCGNFCAPYQDNALAFHRPGIGVGLVFLSIQSLLFITIIAIIESNFVYRVRNRRRKGEERTDEATTDVIVTSSLAKRYGIIMAVNKLSLCVSRGEAVAVVGVNGAGKTTLLKMLTGEESVSGGDALLDGKTITKNKERFLGYCPQRTELAYKTTVRQMLAVYGQLRGVDKSQLQGLVDNLLSDLGLIHQADKSVVYLSDGDKRILSTAIALVGEPPVVLLDDPATGHDPVSKARFWQTVVNICARGCAVLVTSNSNIDECCSVANRMAVLVNGCLIALDGVESLAKSYCEGYTLVVRIKADHKETRTTKQMQDNQTSFKEYIRVSLPGANLKVQHLPSGFFAYEVTGIRFSEILEKIETVKEEYSVVDYSLNFVSLEWEFLKGFSRTAQTSDECHVVFNSTYNTIDTKLEPDGDSYRNNGQVSVVEWGSETERRYCVNCAFVNHNEGEGFGCGNGKNICVSEGISTRGEAKETTHL